MVDTSQNRLYLAALDLDGARVVVVGGNEMAAEKIVGLRTAGALVTVVAPNISEDVRALVDREPHVEWVARDYLSEDLDGCALVVAVAGDNPVGEAIAGDARRRNIFVNVADVPRLCTFILPAIVRDGPIAVAVSTAGTSPALAQRMRREAAESFGPAYAELALTLNELRPWAKETLATYEQRRDFFNSIVNGSPDPIELLRSGRREELRSLIEAAKQAAVGARA